MPDDPPKPTRDYHRQPSITLRPADEQERARWDARVAHLRVSFTKWVRDLLNKDCEENKQ